MQLFLSFNCSKSGLFYYLSVLSWNIFQEKKVWIFLTIFILFIFILGLKPKKNILNNSKTFSFE